MKAYVIFAVTAVMLAAAEPDLARFGAKGAFQLEYSGASYARSSHGVTERLADGTSKLYPLPQSSFAMYARLRPADLALNPLSATGERYTREETIGPHQIEGEKLWFGNTFYDGEGYRGVGAFGYFDSVARRYRIFSPPQVAPYEVSAILVEPATVWLGLDHFGEDISTFPGGLVKWDRATHAVRRYPIEFVVSKIVRHGESLRLTTRSGYALLNGDKFQRFEGNKPVAQFPPPPSKY